MMMGCPATEQLDVEDVVAVEGFLGPQQVEQQRAQSLLVQACAT